MERWARKKAEYVKKTVTSTGFVQRSFVVKTVGAASQKYAELSDDEIDTQGRVPIQYA